MFANKDDITFINKFTIERISSLEPYKAEILWRILYTTKKYNKEIRREKIADYPLLYQREKTTVVNKEKSQSFTVNRNFGFDARIKKNYHSYKQIENHASLMCVWCQNKISDYDHNEDDLLLTEYTNKFAEYFSEVLEYTWEFTQRFCTEKRQDVWDYWLVPREIQKLRENFPHGCIFFPGDIIMAKKDRNKNVKKVYIRSKNITCISKLFKRIWIKITSDKNTSTEKKCFSEAEYMTNMKHKNIVKFIGVSVEKHDIYRVHPTILMELADSDLRSLIRFERTVFDFKTVHKFAMEIALGLEYIHIEKNLMHNDIKPENILVFGKERTLKICDFDLMGECYLGGTIPYSAPEKYIKQAEYSSDIYSFGIVLAEIIIRDSNIITVLKERKTFDIRSLIIKGDFNNNKYEEFSDLINLCIHCTMIDPKQRPNNGHELVKLLSEMKK